MKAIITLISSFLSIALFAQEPAITLRLMGDSTMADKNLENGNPERGWGQMLKSYVDSSVLVVNYAKNGRSTKDFQTLGYWDTVMSDLKEGDYLFIQFGHNDAKSHDPQRYAAAFGEYPTAIIQVATEYGLPLIDATKITEEWLNSIGDETSRQYFMWLEPGEYVKHPDGLKDNTHTNILGACKIVSLLLPHILVHIPELTTHIIPDANFSKTGMQK